MLTPVFIRANKKLVKVDPSEIVFLVAEKNYTRIFLTDEKSHLVRAAISNVYKQLPADLFLRTHRSYVVSVFYIEEIYKDYVYMSKSTTVPVARNYYEQVLGRLRILE